MDRIDSQFFAMPLNQERNHYYINNKLFGMNVTGAYKFEGKTYECGDHSNCISLYDLGRGRFNYQTSWIWPTLLTRLPETGELFALNLGEGLGTDYKGSGEDKFQEDFMILGGKHYKLDQTLIFDYIPGDHSSTLHFKTVDVPDRVFPRRGCDLRFDPFQDGRQPRDGKHFSLLSFKQDLIYGHFSGTCTLENDGSTRVIKLTQVLGTVEHVRARW
jgi:hypothetical protein